MASDHRVVIKDNAAIQYSPIPQVDTNERATVPIREIKPMFQEVRDNYDGGASPSINRRRLERSQNSFSERMNTYLTLINEKLKQQKNWVLMLTAFILSILAFAAIVSRPHLIGIFCKKNLGTYAAYSYPYKMNRVSLASCSNTCYLTRGNRCSSSAQFFAFVAAVSFIISPAIIVIELLFINSTKRLKLLNKIEIVVALVLTICWFAGSIAWAAALAEIRQITNKAYIAGLIQAQTQFIDCEIYTPTHGSLIVSVLLGFCNFIVWALALFYLLKSSSLFKKRSQTNEVKSIVISASEMK